MHRTPLEGAPDPGGADCVECGRCCFHEPRTVSLHVEDEERMGEALLEELTELMPAPPFFRFLKTVDSHCIGLDVSVEGRHPCAVYAVRPTGCRTVAPGSRPCLEARRLGHLGTCNED